MRYYRIFNSITLSKHERNGLDFKRRAMHASRIGEVVERAADRHAQTVRRLTEIHLLDDPSMVENEEWRAVSQLEKAAHRRKIAAEDVAEVIRLDRPVAPILSPYDQDVEP